MSILPFILRDPWEEMEMPLRLFDQDFGLGMRLDDLYQPIPNLLRRGYYRPWRHVPGQSSGVSSVTSNKDNFQVMLDVQQFRPEEISVKTVDNSIVVEGKHEEKRDEHGFVSRQFVRRYLLPEGTKPETVTSTLSSDGVLTISAPKALPITESNERAVPITQTGAPAVKEAQKSSQKPAEVEEAKK